MKRVMIVHMLKSRPFLWGIAVVGLIVLTAGVSTGVAKGGLPGPGWLLAGVTGALVAVSATVAALRPVFVKVVQSGVDQSIKRADSARELRERLGGAKGRFLRVSEIRSRALRYGVQQAIPLDGGPVEGLSADLPRYLPRTIDGPLRSALTARSTTGGMVILKGSSTWGKSRSMFEAVSQVLGDWLIVAPSSASDVRDLVESGLSLSRTVVWLDELVDFLTGNDPLRRDVVQRAVDKGAILVGTIWKDDFAALTVPPKKMSADGLARSTQGSGSGEVDVLADARAILTATYGDLIEMPDLLDEKEAAVALPLAAQDPRWAQAVAGAGELSPIQVLAAAPQLLARYRSPDDEPGGIVLRAAVALLAMEHPPPVPVDLLRRVAQAALPPTLVVEPDRWFDDALAWARRPVRGTIAPLKAYRSDTGGEVGYIAPDLLVSEAREAGGLQDQVDLDLTSTFATAEACAAIGSFFYIRDEDNDAEPFLRRAAEGGVARAFHQYGFVLSAQEGGAAEAEKWYLKAVDAGEAVSFNLGLLAAKDGRTAEAEAWYRKAVAEGEANALNNLGTLLTEQEGRTEEAEECYRKAAAAGDVSAMANLGILLSAKEGCAAEAEEWHRRAADAGDLRAMVNLGTVLGQKEGGAGEAEEWYRIAAATGDADAMHNLGLLLSEQEGRAGEAEAWYRQAVEMGDTDSMFGLGALLEGQEGRALEAEDWYRQAADEGDTDAMVNLGIMLDGQKGRADEAEAWFRKAVDAGDANALNNLGDALKRQGRYEEARSVLQGGIAAEDPHAMLTMAELDLLEGRRDAARTWLEKATSLGVDEAGELLAEEFGEDPPPME